MRHYIISILILCFLSSCGEENGVSIQKDKLEYREFVLNLQFEGDEEMSSPSFPVWFNDSIIREKKVKSITRKTYNLNDHPDDGKHPKKEMIYSFNQDGKVVEYRLIHSYEGMQVLDIIFDYSHGIDGSGYGDFESNESHLKTKIEFPGYKKISSTDMFYAYQKETDGTYLFYVPNTANWGGLTIDSLLNPTSDDIIVLGSPKKPVKRYQVENRVNERNRREYQYNQTGAIFLRSTVDRDPFITSREVVFDDRGRCQGFIDSIFNLNDFLYTRESMFQMNEKELPTQLNHSVELKKNETKNLQIETFYYTYYDDVITKNN